MEVQKRKVYSSMSNPRQADRDVEITVFVDPLCCWSWAFYQQVDNIKTQVSANINWIYRMGGLLPSWKNFHDEANSVVRPGQLGPVWMHAGQVANKPIHHQLWLTDPPASSYPACIAVKCAQIQSEAFGETLLAMLWQACMGDGKNIAKQEVLFDIVQKLAVEKPGFDFTQFKNDYTQDKGINAFRADLELVKYYNINRFPTLIIRSADKKARILSGYQDSNNIIKAIEASTVE